MLNQRQPKIGGSTTAMSGDTGGATELMLSKARALAANYTSKQLYSTALYWADKAFSLSAGEAEDLARYVQALYQCKQYQRAANIMHSSGLLPCSPGLCYLAAR